MITSDPPVQSFKFAPPSKDVAPYRPTESPRAATPQDVDYLRKNYGNQNLTPRQLAFFDKLTKYSHSKNEGIDPFKDENRMDQVRYESIKPEVNDYFNPTKAINLMIRLEDDKF